MKSIILIILMAVITILAPVITLLLTFESGYLPTVIAFIVAIIIDIIIAIAGRRVR